MFNIEWDSMRKRYVSILLIAIIIGIVGLITGYIIFSKYILESIEILEGELIPISVIFARMILLSGIAFHLYVKWLKQEHSYLTDIPFLMALSLIFLVFGKGLHLLHNLIHFTAPEIVGLTVLRIRFAIVIMKFLPLLTIGLYLYLYHGYQERPVPKGVKVDDHINKVRLRIIILLLAIQMFLILIAADTTVLGILTPVIIIPSLLFIIWTFYLAHKYKRIKQISAGLVTLGFTLYLLSSILRPILQNTLEALSYITISETIDLIIYIIIGIGFMKPSTSKV